VVKHWNRLSREVVVFQSLKTVKTQLDMAMSNLL